MKIIYPKNRYEIAEEQYDGNKAKIWPVIVLDFKNKLLYTDQHGENFANTEDFFYRTKIKIRIPYLSVDSVNELLDDISPLFSLAIDGFEVGHRGSTEYGIFTEVAEEKIHSIENLIPCQSDFFLSCAEEYISANYPTELSADSTDAEIEKMALELYEDALEYDKIDVEGIAAYLIAHRDNSL